MLADAMSNTNPTAISRVRKVCCTSDSHRSRIGNTLAVMPKLLAGYCSASPAAMAFIVAWACSIVTPGLSRPTTKNECEPRD